MLSCFGVEGRTDGTAIGITCNSGQAVEQLEVGIFEVIVHVIPEIYCGWKKGCGVCLGVWGWGDKQDDMYMALDLKKETFEQ